MCRHPLRTALDLTRVRHAHKNQPAVTSIGQAEDSSGDLREFLPVGARARSFELNAPPFTGSDEFEKFLVSHGKDSTGFAPQGRSFQACVITLFTFLFTSTPSQNRGAP